MSQMTAKKRRLTVNKKAAIAKQEPHRILVLPVAFPHMMQNARMSAAQATKNSISGIGDIMAESTLGT